MSYELKWETNGVVKKFTGTVNDDEFMAATEEVQGHSGFDRIGFVINDLLEVTNFEVTAEVMMSYFASVSGAYRSNPNIKLTFVTKNPKFEGEINKFVLISPLPYRSRVFDSVTDARHWCKAQKFEGGIVRSQA